MLDQGCTITQRKPHIKRWGIYWNCHGYLAATPAAAYWAWYFANLPRNRR